MRFTKMKLEDLGQNVNVCFENYQAKLTDYVQYTEELEKSYSKLQEDAKAMSDALKAMYKFILPEGAQKNEILALVQGLDLENFKNEQRLTWEEVNNETV